MKKNLDSGEWGNPRYLSGYVGDLKAAKKTVVKRRGCRNFTFTVTVLSSGGLLRLLLKNAQSNIGFCGFSYNLERARYRQSRQ
jgi:hypothetical protein